MTTFYQTNRLKNYLFTFLFVACSTQASLALAEVRYELRDLGTLGGDRSYGTAINASGQVTGGSRLADGRLHAFVTDSNGTMIDITKDADSAYGSGINNYGQAVGYLTRNGGVNPEGFYTDRTGQLIEFTASESQGTYARDINDASQITGDFYREKDKRIRVFRTDTSAEIIDLDPTNIFGGNLGSLGIAINALGQIIGGDPGLGQYSFYTKKNGDLALLDGLGGLVKPEDINDSGQVTGGSTFSVNVDFPRYRAFINDTENNTVVNLDPTSKWFRSYGNGINNIGQVVGMFSLPLDYDRAFTTDNNGIMVDLNTLLVSSATGWRLETASDINDAGQIVGTMTNGDQYRAFILTPVIVPLPAAAWLFLSGLLGFFATNLRKKIALP